MRPSRLIQPSPGASSATPYELKTKSPGAWSNTAWSSADFRNSVSACGSIGVEFDPLAVGEPDSVARARERVGEALEAEAAEELGLVTAAYDEVDWDEEVRLLLEERASFSPDALTGLEANLRFAGPETMETKIFGRLTAWQNWIFQRPNSAGDKGALKRYGSGQRADFDPERV